MLIGKVKAVDIKSQGGLSKCFHRGCLFSSACRSAVLTLYNVYRFRAGFKQAFRWCPFVPEGSYEGLEMKSTRYLHTQTSMYKTSRMETTMSTVLPQGTDEDSRPGAFVCAAGGVTAARRTSADLASNGSSSRSVSKTVSETSSFYSSNNLPE